MHQPAIHDESLQRLTGTLGHHIAAVTNSIDNSVSRSILRRSWPSMEWQFQRSTYRIPNTPPNPQPVPYAIGINSLTHRGLVALQATNTAEVLDFSTGVPVFVTSVGGTLTPIGTGLNPAVAIDPKLNSGISTPAAQVLSSIVDLGHNPGAGSAQPTWRVHPW